MHEFYYKLDKHQENNTILVSTPQVSTQAKLTIGYYDDEYYYKKLRESFYDYVYYTQESFPCQENDQKCMRLRTDIVSYLDKHYELYFKLKEGYLIYRKRS